MCKPDQLPGKSEMHLIVASDTFLKPTSEQSNELFYGRKTISAIKARYVNLN